jgi:hypothetical protein
MTKFWQDYKSGFIHFLENFSAPTNLILLLIAYLVGVGLSTLLAKTFGGQKSWSKIEPSSESYWENYEPNTDIYSQY